MAATSPKGLDDSQISWTSSTRRPKPQMSASNTHVVSRNSGLHSDVGTFGGSSRFGDKVIGPGASSPDGRDFYKRNSLFKTSMEKGLECTMGIGSRPELSSMKVPKSVGPGSYKIVASAAKRRSPLDGPEYCNMHIHGKLPSKLVPADLCSPGPHHKYEIRKPLDHDRPTFAVSSLGKQGRHPFPEDRDTPGPGYYPMQDVKSVSGSVSSPELGRIRTVKSTFGVADRFKSQSVPNSSPNGEYYYSHYKPKDPEEYLAGARSCTFGKGDKTDFSNPYRAPTNQVSPVSYKPCTSIAYKTSAIDGLTERLESPVKAHVKGIMNSKKSRSMTSFRDMTTKSAKGMGGDCHPASKAIDDGSAALAAAA